MKRKQTSKLMNFVKKVLLQTKTKFLTIYRVVSQALVKKRDKLRGKVENSLELAKELSKKVEWVKLSMKALNKEGDEEYKLNKGKLLLIAALLGPLLMSLGTGSLELTKSLGEFLANPDMRLIASMAMSMSKVLKQVVTVLVTLGFLGFVVYVLNFIKAMFWVLLASDRIVLSIIGIIILVLADLVLLGFNAFVKIVLFVNGFGIKNK